jgi:hypothetical protein
MCVNCDYLCLFRVADALDRRRDVKGSCMPNTRSSQYAWGSRECGNRQSSSRLEPCNGAATTWQRPSVKVSGARRLAYLPRFFVNRPRAITLLRENSA